MNGYSMSHRLHGDSWPGSLVITVLGPGLEAGSESWVASWQWDHEVETAAGRYQPSSRIASKGELSFPWNLLQS
jgi:hypothetical protein